MAILKDSLEGERASISIRVYAAEPTVYSMLISAQERTILLELSKRECIVLATKLLEGSAYLMGKGE